MRTIDIGKEGNQAIVITEDTVSRHHARLCIYDDGRMTLTDTNSANGTFLKKRDNTYEQIWPNSEKAVNRNMIVRFGPYFEVPLSKLIPGGPVGPGPQPPKKETKIIDITALGQLQRYYNNKSLELEQKQNTVNNLRSFTIIFSLIGTGAGGWLGSQIFPDDKVLGAIISGVTVILLMACFVWYLTVMSKRVIKEKRTLDYNFRRSYCCPNCKYPFGNLIYENLINTECPRCKGKFVENAPQPQPFGSFRNY